MRTRILLGGMFTFLILGADNQVLPQPKSATDPLVPELPAPNPKSGFQRLKKEREALNRERDGATQDLEPKSDPLPAETRETHAANGGTSEKAQRTEIESAFPGRKSAAAIAR